MKNIISLLVANSLLFIFTFIGANSKTNLLLSFDYFNPSVNNSYLFPVDYYIIRNNNTGEIENGQNSWVTLDGWSNIDYNMIQTNPFSINYLEDNQVILIRSNLTNPVNALVKLYDIAGREILATTFVTQDYQNEIRINVNKISGTFILIIVDQGSSYSYLMNIFNSTLFITDNNPKIFKLEKKFPSYQIIGMKRGFIPDTIEYFFVPDKTLDTLRFQARFNNKLSDYAINIKFENIKYESNYSFYNIDLNTGKTNTLTRTDKLPFDREIMFNKNDLRNQSYSNQSGCEPFQFEYLNDNLFAYQIDDYQSSSKSGIQFKLIKSQCLIEFYNNEFNRIIVDSLDCVFSQDSMNVNRYSSNIQSKFVVDNLVFHFDAANKSYNALIQGNDILKLSTSIKYSESKSSRDSENQSYYQRDFTKFINLTDSSKILISIRKKE
jgi:hypothetical protein